MPRLSWNEIQKRAVAFIAPWHPLTMPPELTRAHQALDRAVDRLYWKKPFESDKERLELLFKRYQELTGANPWSDRTRGHFGNEAESMMDRCQLCRWRSILAVTKAGTGDGWHYQSI